jgi:lipopolysaccharide heptosyltransferase I
MEGPKEILLVRFSSLGDILLCMPLARALKERLGARISWVVQYPISQFLLFQGLADEVLVFPRKAIEAHLREGRWGAGLLMIRAFLRDVRRKRFDVLLDLHGCLKSAILSLFVRTERRIGLGKGFSKEMAHLFYMEKVNGERRLHKVRRNMLFLGQLGIDGPVPEVEILVPKEKERVVDAFLNESSIEGPFLVVNPFSSRKGSFKRWPLESYEVLIKGLRQRLGMDVVVVFGPEEKEEAELLHKRLKGDLLLPPLFDLFELAALFKRSALYIGGDSGITHLAALSGVPLVSIFGPTDHLINGPYSKKAVVVRKDLPCSPCRKKDCKERKCLSAISPSEVLFCAEEILRGSP